MGKEIKVYPQLTGVPVKGKTIATGFPPPKKTISIRSDSFGIVSINESGVMYISSAAVATSGYFYLPFSYFTD